MNWKPNLKLKVSNNTNAFTHNFMKSDKEVSEYEFKEAYYKLKLNFKSDEKLLITWGY